MQKDDGILQKVNNSDLKLLYNDPQNFWEGVSCIGKNAFFYVKRPIASYFFKKFYNPMKLSIPNNIKFINDKAFSYIDYLESVAIADSVEEIGKECFSECFNLRKVVLSNGIRSLPHSVFKNCYRLTDIIIPSSVKIIEAEAFYDCYSLKNILIPEGVKKIGDLAFAWCKNIKELEIPNSVERIGAAAFDSCESLNRIKLPSDLIKINCNSFWMCKNLETIELPKNLEIIGKKAFWGCKSLKEVIIPESVNVIEEEAFYGCKSLKKIVLPQYLDEISCSVFCGCDNLKEIYFPRRVMYLDVNVFSGCRNLEKMILNVDDGDVAISYKNVMLIQNSCGYLFMYDSEKELYSFYKDGKYVEFSESLLEENESIKQMIDDYEVTVKDYIKLYYWSKKKFIPSSIVVVNMPIEDIDKFYVNDNCEAWRNLLKLSNIKNEENKITFFKLCYVLGVFNEKSSIRDKAVKFIEEKIIGEMDESDIHSKFEGFNLQVGYNKEYADFFMKYFTSMDFMVTVDDNGEEIDLTIASYNNFDKVKSIYPNKIVNTNRKKDILLPEHVIESISYGQYKNVEAGNEELSFIIGRYGYTQQQFEEIQNLFDIGKSIEENNIKLFISKDRKDNEINYELLDKDNPLGVVLGNITNCCQIIGGVGESCVRYGITQPNSKFMKFNYNNTIIGQSWVWYDEFSKTICLDNIEVPKKYCDKIKRSEKMQKEFVECLIRMCDNFESEMKKNGLEVKSVVIGRGHNDISYVLEENFKLSMFSYQLSDYKGYSDANERYLISGKKHIVKK